MPWDTIVKEFISLWVVIDPIGSIPVFIAVTVGLASSLRRKVAIKACLFAAVILLFFLLLGQLLLEQLGIALGAFQIAGGMVLFLFALSMIFGDSKPEEETRQIKEDIANLKNDFFKKPFLQKMIIRERFFSVFFCSDNYVF